MRYLLWTILSLLAAPAVAQLDSDIGDRLCAVAAVDSGLGSTADTLIEEGRMAPGAGEKVASYTCPDGKALLAHLVEQQQAENLEYLVIDMGLTLEQSRVVLEGRQLSLKEALQRIGERGDGQTRAFVQEYLKSLADAMFNPNVRLGAL